MVKNITCPNCGLTQQSYTTNRDNQLITCLRCNYRWLNIAEKGIRDLGVKVVMDSVNHYNYTIKSTDNKKNAFPVYVLNNKYINKKNKTVHLPTMPKAGYYNNYNLNNNYNIKNDYSHLKQERLSQGQGQQGQGQGQGAYERAGYQGEINKNYARVGHQGLLKGQPSQSYGGTAGNFQGNAQGNVQSGMQGNGQNTRATTYAPQTQGAYEKVGYQGEIKKDYARGGQSHQGLLKGQPSQSYGGTAGNFQGNVQGNFQSGMQGNGQNTRATTYASQAQGAYEKVGYQGEIKKNYAREGHQGNNYTERHGQAYSKEEKATYEKAVYSGGSQYTAGQKHQDSKQPNSLNVPHETFAKSHKKQEVKIKRDIYEINLNQNNHHQNNSIEKNSLVDKNKNSAYYAKPNEARQVGESAYKPSYSAKKVESEGYLYGEEDRLKEHVLREGAKVREEGLGRLDVYAATEKSVNETASQVNKNKNLETPKFSYNSLKLKDLKDSLDKEIKAYDVKNELEDEELNRQFELAKNRQKMLVRETETESVKVNSLLKDASRQSAFIKDDEREQGKRKPQKKSSDEGLVKKDFGRKYLDEKYDSDYKNLNQELLSIYKKRNKATKEFSEKKGNVNNRDILNLFRKKPKVKKDEVKSFFEKTEGVNKTLSYTYKDIWQEIKSKLLSFKGVKGKVKFGFYVGLVVLIIYAINLPQGSFNPNNSNYKFENKSVASIPTIDESPLVSSIVPGKESSVSGLVLGDSPVKDEFTKNKVMNVIEESNKNNSKKEVLSVDKEQIFNKHFDADNARNLQNKQASMGGKVLSKIQGSFSLAYLNTKQKTYNIFSEVQVVRSSSAWKIEPLNNTFETFVTIANKDKNNVYIINSLDIIFADNSGNILEERTINPNQVIESKEDIVLKIRVPDVPFNTMRSYVFIKEKTLAGRR